MWKGVNMRYVKFLIAILATICILGANFEQVSAGNGHKAECDSQVRRVQCGAYVANVSMGAHLLYNTNNGGVYCSMTHEKHLHNIYCANSSCNVLFSSNEVRTCLEKHSSCEAKTGICQY